MPLAFLLTLAAQDKIQTVPLTLSSSGVTQHVGGYPSIALPMSTKKPAELTRLPAGASNPVFGTLKLGRSRFFVLLATVGKAQRLFVDSNSDGDLSNDPPDTWRPKSGEANASGAAQVRLPFRGQRALCNLIFVQTGPKMLTVLTDYGFVGRLNLGAREMPFYLIDGAAKGFPDGSPAGATLGIDRKGNGVVSGAAEQYAAELPFTIGGTSLVLRSVDLAHGTATFVPSEKVPEIPLPRTLAANQASPSFSGQTLDGKAVSFPSDFSGRVVLLYAWASWSKPSLDWLPKLSRVYDAYKNLSFSVLGVCLNRAGEADAARGAAAQMPWTTAYDGKSWAGEAARALNLDTLPFVLLVDGKTGRIIATMDDMIGDKFESVIRSAVVGQG